MQTFFHTKGKIPCNMVQTQCSLTFHHVQHKKISRSFTLMFPFKKTQASVVLSTRRLLLSIVQNARLCNLTCETHSVKRRLRASFVFLSLRVRARTYHINTSYIVCITTSVQLNFPMHPIESVAFVLVVRSVITSPIRNTCKRSKDQWITPSVSSAGKLA